MKGNKGFTLIELIVVIAIIAVLAVVLAPQYIQYVEKGRESNDLQVAQNIIDAAQIAVVDPNNEIPGGYYVLFRWDTSTSSRGPGNGQGNLYLDATRGGQSAATLPWLTVLNDSVRHIMGVDSSATTIGNAQSSAAKTDDLLFRINTTTGEVEVHSLYKYLWIDQIGVTAGYANY